MTAAFLSKLHVATEETNAHGGQGVDLQGREMKKMAYQPTEGIKLNRKNGLYFTHSTEINNSIL